MLGNDIILILKSLNIEKYHQRISKKNYLYIEYDCQSVLEGKMSSCEFF